MSSKKSLSIIAPAYNEVSGLENSIKKALSACEILEDEYEIIIVDDCSTDSTLQIAQRLAQQNSRVSVIHNSINLGFGGAFRTGLDRAKYQNSLILCTDDGIDVESLKSIFRHLGSADLLICYVKNPECRSRTRRMISWVYVKMIDTLFGLNVSYYNGMSVFPTESVKRIHLSDSFAFMAEIIVNLLKTGHSYKEIPYITKQRPEGGTSAFRLKNILGVGKAILRLWLNIQVYHTHDKIFHLPEKNR